LIAPFIPFLLEPLRTIKSLENYAIIPIPMPRIRKLLRGYNQAELIALALKEQLGLPVHTDILTRIISPRRQVTLHKKEDRIKNQKGTFKVLRDVTHMQILLVDDVTTTGATLEEAKKVLLACGATDVKAITLAH